MNFITCTGSKDPLNSDSSGRRFKVIGERTKCTYPKCKCPFDMGADNKCLPGHSATLKTVDGHPIQGYDLIDKYRLVSGGRGKGAKLTCRDVELIRRMSRWGMSYAEIKQRFSVSHGVIGSVVNKATYKDCK